MGDEKLTKLAQRPEDTKTSAKSTGVPASASAHIPTPFSISSSSSHENSQSSTVGSESQGLTESSAQAAQRSTSQVSQKTPETPKPAVNQAVNQAQAAFQEFTQQISSNMSETREEWEIELNRDFEEAAEDKERAKKELRDFVEDIEHPSRIVQAGVAEGEQLKARAEEIGHDLTHPQEVLSRAQTSAHQEFKKVAAEMESIDAKLRDPIDQQKLPVLMKVYGWLCVLCGLAVTGATIKALVDSIAMFSDGGMANYGTSTVVVTFIHLIVIGLLALTFIVFGSRLLSNERKSAAYLAYGIYLFLLAGAVCSLMLSGVTWDIGIYVAFFAVTVAVQSYLDPSLRDERKLQRLLRQKEDLKEAEAGTLGRDPEGKGYITLNFFNLFWIFVVCSVLGMFMEDIVHVLVVDPGHWQDRAGLLFGPFSPIYGCGAVLMTIFLNRFHKKNLVLIFFLSAIIGGAFEYFTSWFMQYTYGAVAWDYTGQWLSIGGRTCGWAMACWGILGCLWIKVLLPFLLHVINLIPWNWRYGVTTVCAAFMLVDAVMSLQALDCWYERLSDNPINTPIQKFYDEHFGNTFMEDRFQSMTINPDDAIRHGKTATSEAAKALS